MSRPDWWRAVALAILIGFAWPFTVIARIIVGRPSTKKEAQP